MYIVHGCVGDDDDFLNKHSINETLDFDYVSQDDNIHQESLLEGIENRFDSFVVNRKMPSPAKNYDEKIFNRSHDSFSTNGSP